MTQQPEPNFEGTYTFAQDEPFRLRGGGELSPVELRYALYGELNQNRDNAILVCHALSGSARAADWWPEMVGPGKAIDTDRYCIIGINVLGSCYGSTGPLSIDPKTGNRFSDNFPVVSLSDVVKSQARLIDHLGIEKLFAVIGGSIGGMQAIEWATAYPERIRHSIAVGAAPLSALGLAMNHLQRDAIRNDPAWLKGEYEAGKGPDAGLALARKIAMCTYKAEALFTERFHRKPNRSGDDPWTSPNGRFDVSGYLDYQGDIFTRRFDANSYISLTRTMDLFDLVYQGESEKEKLARITSRILLIGISSDWLFPPIYVREVAERLKRARVDVNYREFDSHHGHDAFLADAGKLGSLVQAELEQSVYAPARIAVNA